MKLKKWWSVCLVAVLAALMIMSVAGCGDEASDDSPATTEAGAETQTTAAAEAPEVGESSAVTETTETESDGTTTVLRLAAVDNDQGYASEAIKTFASEVENRTEGRYKVEVGWACSYGGPGEFFDLVANGLVDIAYFLPCTSPGVFPATDMTALPWVLPNAAIATDALQALVEQGYGMDESMSAVKFLNVHMGPGHVLMTSKPVDSIQDFAGMKIISGGDMQAAAMSAIGATPVYFDHSEFYGALQKGIADANYNPWIGVAPWNLHEVIDYVLETNIGNVFCGFIMNWDSFDGMSPEDQQVLDEVAKEAFGLIVKGYEDVAQAGKDAFLAKGGTIIPMPEDDFAFLNEAFAGLWNEWIADMESQGIPATEACNAMYGILEDLGVQTPAIGYQP